jgi:hypothetical protein
MDRRLQVILIGIIILLSVAGCDSFSLLDQFSRGLSLVLQKSTVKPGEQSLLYPGGGIEPYSFAVVAENLYDTGQTSDPGTIMNHVYTAGESIGTVKIWLTDSVGNHVEKQITVLPWKPLNFNVNGYAPGPTTIELFWTYNSPGYIEGFRILRSKDGGPFEEIFWTGSSTWCYADESASPQENTYRLYAVAGEFESVYAVGSAYGNSGSIFFPGREGIHFTDHQE